MINHIIHYYNDGFCYTWTIRLPFRLNKGDEINNSLLDTNGILQHEKVETEEWVKFCCKYEYFEVQYIQIDHNANVVAWLMIPKS